MEFRRKDWPMVGLVRETLTRGLKLKVDYEVGAEHQDLGTQEIHFRSGSEVGPDQFSYLLHQAIRLRDRERRKQNNNEITEALKEEVIEGARNLALVREEPNS